MTRDKRLFNFLAITFIITYASWGLLYCLVERGILVGNGPARILLHMLGGFGPTIGGILMLKKRSFRNVIKFIFSYEKSGLPFFLLICLLQSLVIGLSSDGRTEMPLFMAPMVLITTTLIGGGNEELGWRGYMQPELEKRFAFPIATAITGLVWAVWHLPLWFIDGMMQAEVPFPMFAAYAVALSFYLAAIYKRTRSVFFCMIFHGLSNALLSVSTMGVNFIFFAGMVLLLLLSITTWHKVDRAEKKN